MHSTPYIWGQVYAVLHHLLRQKLTPTALNNAAISPRDNLGICLTRVPRVPDWADDRFTDLLANISADAKSAPLTLVQQGEFFLGYHHERSRLEKIALERSGRPSADDASNVDWTAVDWGLRNAEIARAVGVSPQAVAWQRAKRDKAAK